MPPPDKHPDEENRLAALLRYDILDTSTEQEFDDITRLVAHLCDAPIAVINLVDRDRQWFKSEVGLGMRETPLDVSLCAHAILQPGLLVVPDLFEDARFRDNPLVTAKPHLRFYAGALLESDDGQPLGTLCVLDDKPRAAGLSDTQREALSVLARQVMTQMELRRLVARQAQTIAAREQAKEEISRLYQREKRIAETFQRALLVPRRALRFPDLLVEPQYAAAWDEANVGGDFYDAFRLADGRVALVVGDVSGKGLAAAVRTAEVRYALRALLSSDQSSPARTLGLLNAYLCQAHTHDAAFSEDRDDENSGDFAPRFIVAALAVLDPATGETVCSLAGGEPPVVLRACAAKGAETPICHSVTITGLPLGVVPDVTYDEERIVLAPGDTLLLVTDGITEARSRSGAFLEYDGLLHLAAQAVMTTGGSLADMGTAILDGARAFADGALRDDACLLLARRP